MSIIGTIVGGGVAEPIKAVGGILDDLFTSEEEKLSKKEALVRLEQKPHLAQAAINRAEAQSRSAFVAGWRPFIGWTCGVGIAWHFVIYDLLTWILSVSSPATPAPPELVGTDELMTLVLSLLGLGGMRTFEKYVGRAK